MSEHRNRTGALSRLFARRSSRLALGILILLTVGALLGWLVVGETANRQPDIVGLKNAPPSLRHLFGTDQFSRDVFARVLVGAGISLAIGALAVLFSTVVGTSYGMIAGYAGGRTDVVMMRVLDGLMSIPRVLLLVALLTVWRPGLPGLIFVIGATGWFTVARLVRAEVLTIRDIDFIAAARALGASSQRTIWRHLLPNVAAPVIVSATLGVGNVILLEAGLSYLGIGAQKPTPSWGSIFLDGVGYGLSAWWVLLFPGLAIVATVLSFNLLGDALRDVLDPRQVHLARPLPESTLELSRLLPSHHASASDHPAESPNV
ncbi:MAG TPA: ABC transporter permease [Gemmatimonadaceae bacterium]